MQDPIETPRLRLVRLTNTDEGSQHLQWFHEHWSDDASTAWSLHGKCHNIKESREWMIEILTKMDNILYAVFTKREESQASADVTKMPGDFIGTMGLRRQLDGPALPPPPPPPSALSSDDSCSTALAEPATTPSLDLRVIGYAFFESTWGKGYATEAGKALLAAYSASVADQKKEGKQVFYIEAGVDEGNPDSLKVLKKLGFEEVGWKEVSYRVFLAGQWREGGYWIYGMYA